jgi:hypothetical protein
MVGSLRTIPNILALIKSNEEQRTIVKTTQTKVVPQGQQGLYFLFTFPELRTVEQLLHVEFDTDPEKWIISAGWIQDKTYDGNTVGMSIYMAIGMTVTDQVNGTTLQATAVALGI